MRDCWKIERRILMTFRRKGRSWLTELNRCSQRCCDGNLKGLWIKRGSQSWRDSNWSEGCWNGESLRRNRYERFYLKTTLWDYRKYNWLNLRTKRIDRFFGAKLKEMDHVGKTVKRCQQKEVEVKAMEPKGKIGWCLTKAWFIVLGWSLRIKFKCTNEYSRSTMLVLSNLKSI